MPKSSFPIARELALAGDGGVTAGWRFARELVGAPIMSPAAPAASPDAELLALAQDIEELIEAADEILLTRVEPHDEAYERALDAGGGQVTQESFERAMRISGERGRSSAIAECNSLLHGADLLFARMRRITPCTPEGRKAKVRALLTCVLGADWRGSSADMDYEKHVTRELLGELAGMSAVELEAI